MSYLLAIFLGMVQGLTEFLPISSSGHLVLLQKIFGVGEGPVFFDTVLHLGTLLAVLLFFGRELGRVERVPEADASRRYGARFRVLRNVVVGTIPIAVVGLIVQPFVKEVFDSLLVVGVGYFITAALLFWSKSFSAGQKKFTELTSRQTLLIGGFQAVAIFPGISRSGATIVEGLSQKLSREEAFKFSFYLSVPAILGANILQLRDLSSINFLPQSLLGMAAAFVVGHLALNLLQKVLTAGKLHYFSAYCFLMGIISLLTFLKP